MEALILEEAKCLTLRDIDIEESLGPEDVRIKMHSVGICGSDIHFYEYGRIGPFVVTEPIILGHEGSGTVIETGKKVKNLQAGDRVCMEPGIPELNSKATLLGLYNLDPAVTFWGTPPTHGCLRETVVHPAMFVYKLPENVGYNEGALVEPLSVGLQAVKKACIQPGDVAVVTGAGTIGLVTAMAALAGGCSKVNITRQNLKEVVDKVTDGWGADIILEASGNEAAIANIFEPLCPGGKVIFIGMPVQPITFDVVAAQVKEARIETIFRYAHVYPRAIALIESEKVDVKSLITDRYKFEDSIAAFEYASNPKPTTVKVVIEL